MATETGPQEEPLFTGGERDSHSLATEPRFICYRTNAAAKMVSVPDHTNLALNYYPIPEGLSDSVDLKKIMGSNDFLFFRWVFKYHYRSSLDLS